MKKRKPRIKLGDEVILVHDKHGFEGEYVGQNGIVIAIDNHDRLPFDVRFNDGMESVYDREELELSPTTINRKLLKKALGVKCKK